MAQQPTLSSIFEATKGELANSLTGLKLPKDSERVQGIITDYLNQVCDEDSDYRQNLTQSEDYILQAALSMLNAQRALVAAFDTKPQITITQSAGKTETTKHPLADSSISTTTTVLGVGGGAIVGKLLFGGWGAVFGAIAGTAVAIYLSQKASPAVKPSTLNQPEAPRVKVNDTPVDVTALLSVIGHICDSLDNLIATFRAQIKRVVDKYESQEKPTIEREYRVLLEGIQSLIGYKRGHSPEEDKYLSKLQTRVEDLAELLDNYGLEAIDYTPDRTSWFEAVESKNATEIKLVFPAIVKDGVPVLRGKIFIPQTK